MAFNKCPLEVNQMIALLLDDKDVASFAQVCHATNDAIDADYNRFWFLRWRQQFDLPVQAHNGHDQTKNEYKTRMRNMPKIKFNGGLTTKEKVYLETIKAIIIDADPVVGADHRPSSRNITALEHFVKNTNLMEVIFSRAPKAVRFGAPKSGDELLPLVQLVLSALSLRLEHRTVWSFDMSQRLSYMPVTAEPLFRGRGGTDVNLDWALHVINFFRYHALRDEEATLYAPWKDLTEDNSGLGLPQLMKQRLNNDGSAVVGQEWQGTYAYLDRADIKKIRKSAKGQDGYYQDKNIDGGEGGDDDAIQRLKINFPARPKYAWPQVFENHLQSVTFHRDRLSGLVMPAPRGTRQAQHSAMPADTPIFPWGSSRRFEGMGYDEENFFGSGWINPLPAQFGVPGFKRMTMMKFFKDENGLIDIDALWAYEGVVLPGDQIIVGRWWAPEGLDRESKKNMYSGPFILWNVDGLEAHKKEKKLAEQIERLGLDL